MHNIGLYFYRTFFTNYFKHIKDNKENNIEESEKDFAKWLHNDYKPILDLNFDENSVNYFARLDNQKPKNEYSFSLKTLYPGLVCGVGYEHELGFANEFKLGFLFDHTTGLPYLPGSSIKGVIRHYFQMRDYMLELLGEMLKDLTDKKGWYEGGDKELIKQLEIYLKPDDLKKIGWKKLECSIFDGMDYQDESEKLSVYNRDMFLDAFISNTDNENGKILDDDYITSHQHPTDSRLSPFTNPNPVRFLKVSSAVTFTFPFRLVATQISSTCTFSEEIKCELFRRILLDQGIGAKTNVGYGQFE